MAPRCSPQAAQARSATTRSRSPRPTCRGAYTNPLGVQLGPCTYCGFCEKFGCGNYSKASPQTTILPVLMRKPNFTLRTECEVLKINLDASGKRATERHLRRRAGRGIRAAGRADHPVAPIILHNVHLLLLSGIGTPYDPATGEGVVGKNYAYQTTSGGQRLLRRQDPQPLHRRGRARHGRRRFQRRQFRPFGPGLHRRRLHRALERPAAGRSRRIRRRRARRAGARSGRRRSAENYLRIDDDRHARRGDEPSRQLPRPRSDLPRRLWPAADAHDLRLHRQRAQDVGLPDRPRRRDRQGDEAARDQASSRARASTTSCPTRRRTTPAARSWAPIRRTSVVNRYLQSWDVPNLFVMGASAFPQNAGYNPTGTVGALAYWAGRRDQEQIPEIARPAGAGMRRRAIKPASTVGAGIRVAARWRTAAPGRGRRADAGVSFAQVERGQLPGRGRRLRRLPHAPRRASLSPAAAPIETPFGTICRPTSRPTRHRHRRLERRPVLSRPARGHRRRTASTSIRPFRTTSTPRSRATTRRDLRLSAHARPVSNTSAGQPAALSVEHRAVMRGWNGLFLTPGDFQPDPQKIGGMEPRRLSRRGARPLRRLPHAEERARRPTRTTRRCRAALRRTGSRPT